MSKTSDLEKSKIYLFILQVKKPDKGVLKITYFEEYFTDFPSVADIYEYSNNNYSYYNLKSFDIISWDFQTGKTVTEYSYEPYYTTTTYIGFEIKFPKDMKNAKLEGYIDKDLTVYIIVSIIVSIFIIICIAIFIVICCCCKKPNTINDQTSLNQPFYPIDQNQTSPQYNQYNNTPYSNNQYNNNSQNIPPY